MHFFRRVLTTMTSVAVNSARHFADTSHKYVSIPSSLKLQHIVILHRHGDRSQITRELGPNFPENETVTEKWRTLMPDENAKRAMMLATAPGHEILKGDLDIESELYGGWDSTHAPYAQLTHVGHEQLVHVGRSLRSRYKVLPHFTLPEKIEQAYNHLYCRSTHMCRTTQSLRSLLVGLFDLKPDGVPAIHTDAPASHILPHIHTRSEKHTETLFPAANGPMASRRKMLLTDAMATHSIEGYDEIHDKVRDKIGADLVNWIVVKEVLTCHNTHNISLVEGLTEQELEKVDEIAGWIWGVLYKDKVLNRMAIGRFLHEMLEDMHHAMDETHPAAAAAHPDRARVAANKTALIYSGHDSTLVPVLCALEVYEGQWPPYASHLTFELARATDAEGVAEGEMYVRAVYNDEPVAMFSKSRESEAGHGACSAGNRFGAEWMKFSEFERRLRDIALTPEEYDAAVMKHEREEAAAAVAAGGIAEEDTAATLEK